MATPGFRIRLHSSLVSPLLLGGVPRRFAILNGTLAAAVVLGLQAYYAFPLFMVTHGIAAFLTKRDPYFFDVGMRSLRKRHYYHV